MDPYPGVRCSFIFFVLSLKSADGTLKGKTVHENPRSVARAQTLAFAEMAAAARSRRAGSCRTRPCGCRGMRRILDGFTWPALPPAEHILLSDDGRVSVFAEEGTSTNAHVRMLAHLLETLSGVDEDSTVGLRASS